MGSMARAVLPIILLEFLFFRRFFSLSKEKKVAKKEIYSSFAACAALSHASAMIPGVWAGSMSTPSAATQR